MNKTLSKKETNNLRIFLLATILWTWTFGMIPVILGIRLARIFYQSQWQGKAFAISPLWFFAFVIQCMSTSLVISIAHILSKHNYFAAATIHGIGNAALGLLFTSLSVSGSNLAKINMIALNFTIGVVIMLVFCNKFKARCDKEVEQICINKERFGLTEVYKDKESTLV